MRPLLRPTTLALSACLATAALVGGPTASATTAPIPLQPGATAAPAQGVERAAAPSKAVIERALLRVKLNSRDAGLPRAEQSRGLGSATNDLCGSKVAAASDRLRLGRVQTWFYKTKGGSRTTTAVGSEVVVYRKGGADRLWAELKSGRCQKTQRVRNLRYKVRSVEKCPAALTRPDSVAVFVEATYDGGSTQDWMTCYQRKRDVVSILYVQGADLRDSVKRANRLSPVVKRKLNRFASMVPRAT